MLITRFWYIRPLNPRIASFTGLTRDGTFLIENGKISRPVTNFRFNQSLSELLANVEMLGRPVRVAANEDSSSGTAGRGGPRAEASSVQSRKHQRRDLTRPARVSEFRRTFCSLSGTLV